MMKQIGIINMTAIIDTLAQTLMIQILVSTWKSKIRIRQLVHNLFLTTTLLYLGALF